jgi:hypothetical protein
MRHKCKEVCLCNGCLHFLIALSQRILLVNNS